MNRTILMIAGVSGTSSFLLFDSTVKGTALLLLAAAVALLLRRDSAATRHLVWLLAIIALLVAPLLSALLPGWRVLPAWAGIAARPAVVDKPSPDAARVAVSVQSPPNIAAAEVEPSTATAYPSAAQPPDEGPTLAQPPVPPAPAARNWNWINALPFVWATGFCVLILRLMAARWLLRNCERRGTLTGHDATEDPIVVALEAARSQLRIARPVTPLIHPNRTIPIVWGILRCRMLLPAAARDWSAEQLRSVMLHELAHVKRRDMLAQLLAQVACSLHWFNPLAWLAAWRLAVERERACDDLVLASGVRASAYAGHLLDVVSNSAPARLAQSCGLAMARKSSLEGRLLAVLSGNCNRRRVSVALAAMALLIAAGVAVPVAMLRAADPKQIEKPQPASDDAKPQAAVKLDQAMEQNLKWGEPVNGLRAAVVLQPAGRAPKAGEAPELYVAVQNVSVAPIQVNDTLAQEQPRMLYIKIDGKIQMGLGAKDPRLGDVTLQPREVTLVPMFDPDTKMNSPRDPTVDGHTAGQAIAEGALKDTHQSLVVHMIIEQAPAGAWTGKLITGDTTAATASGQPHPTDKGAQALFNLWRHHVRANGNFPGGLVERLGEKVKQFVKVNTPDAAGSPYAKKMTPLLGRFDGSRDWTAQEVVALMDDIATVSAAPLSAMTDEINEHTFRTGAPLPKQLADAPWGAVQPSGLRLAWLLEPRAAEHPLGTALKSRILIQNTGNNVVVFRTRTWHQGNHTARDASGAELKLDATHWLTRAPLVPFRLWPGEYIELTATGIGLGATRHDDQDWKSARVGSWIEAKAGDDVTVMTAPLPLSDWNQSPPKNGAPSWWLELIKADLAQNLPLPTDPEERRRLVYRVGMEVFGTPLSKDEIDAFVSDHESTALDALANRFAQRTGTTPFTGELTSAPTKFKVLPSPKPVLDALHGAIAPPEPPAARPAATPRPKP
jgi:beta-lactamase regulating signal transducer with metallopeptidase domain